VRDNYLLTAALVLFSAMLVFADDRGAPAPRVVTITVDGRAGGPQTIFPPGRGDVVIEYDAEAHEGLQFRYKLEGFDAGWVDAGDRRRAYYTHLPGGQYRFVVETGRNGAWSGATAGASIVLRPPFHRTPLFLFLCVAVVLTMIVTAWALSDRTRS